MAGGAEVDEAHEHIHSKLDRFALESYGWPSDLSDDEILERLLGLKLERAGTG